MASFNKVILMGNLTRDPRDEVPTKWNSRYKLWNRNERTIH